MDAERKSIARRFFDSDEAPIFVIGSSMLILWVSAVAVLNRLGNPVWNNMLQMGFAHAFAGRAGSISAAGLDLPKPLTVFFATYLDVMIMLIIYPILIFSHRHFLERRFYKEHMQPIFDTAERSLPRLRGFAILGIFLFVWFPLWMTGIIAGAVIGYLLRLRTWVTMTTVILGSMTAIIMWVYVLGSLFGELEKSHRILPSVVTFLIILLLVLFRIRSISARRRDEQEAGR